MKPLVRIALAIVVSLPVGAQGTAASFDFSIRNMMRGPELYGRAPQRVRWSADGRWIYFAWNPPGTRWSEPLWNYRVRAVAGAQPERLTAAQFDSAGPLLADGSYSADRRFKAVAHDGDLFLIDVRSGRARRLTQTLENESSPTMTASGTGVYFVRDNNVYHLDVSAALVRQVTNVRSGPAPTDSTFRGQRGALRDQQQALFDALREDARRDSISRADRRAREDGQPRAVYLRAGERLAQISISPHGNALLFTTVIPARGTRQTEVPAYVTASGYTEPLRVRTKVGDEQGDGRVALLKLDGSEVQWLSPGDSSGVAGGGFIAGWNDAGNAALIITYTRDNKQRAIQRVDTSGAINTVDTLRDSAWVLRGCGNNACGTRAGWLPGNRVWFTSEADGYAHLYVADGDGTGRQQLTRGSWEILDVTLDAARRTFFLTTSENSPFDAQVYRMAVTGGARTRITPQPGSHDVVWSPDETMGANVHSFSNRPPELYLIRNRPNEQELAQLTTSPSADWRSFDWKVPEIVMIPASDGKQVPARIYKPQTMNAAPNGAAVIFVHGAGYLHNVGNFWSPYPREYMFNHFLASRGYVVLDIDYRGSAGYGRDWRTAIYRWMGGRDLQDQVDGSKYLQREFGIHPERIGMYGGSYGGFMTLMALFTEPGQFGAGAALRSVTDWAHYNHGYTSNILNTPQTDTLAYRRSSPIYFAEGLEDPLLMAHGMVDVNVHFQDIVRLSQRLIELGKEDWELAVYPVEDHGFVRPDSWTDEYTRIFRLFERSIGANGSKANSRSDRQ